MGASSLNIAMPHLNPIDEPDPCVFFDLSGDFESAEIIGLLFRCLERGLLFSISGQWQCVSPLRVIQLGVIQLRLPCQ